MKKLLTAEEVADFLSVDPATVYRWVEAGRLPAFRLGPGAIRFDPDAVEAWVIGQKVGQRSQGVQEVRPRSDRVSRLRAGIMRESQVAATG